MGASNHPKLSFKKIPGQKYNALAPALVVIVILAATVAYLNTDRDLPANRLTTLEGSTMGTDYSIKIVDMGKTTTIKKVEQLVEQRLKTVDETMSRYNSKSLLSRFNENKSLNAFKMSKEALGLLIYAKDLSKKTGGAFDVTIGPLVRLWGFHEKLPRRTAPDQKEIAEAKMKIGSDKFSVDGSKGVITKNNIYVDIDLSSIAKGYGVDVIAEGLEDLGFNFMVEIGGEVRCVGKNHKNRVWRVGIEKPIYGNREVYRVLSLSNSAMATSGDYRSFYDVEGKRVSHTIDPRSGRPVEHGLASVTVVDKKCMKADALATALTVLGPEDGLAFAEKEGLAAMFIERKADGRLETRMTKKWDE